MRIPRKHSLLLVSLCAVIAVPLSVVGLGVVATGPASAQSAPPWYMYDSYAGTATLRQLLIRARQVHRTWFGAQVLTNARVIANTK